MGKQGSPVPEKVRTLIITEIIQGERTADIARKYEVSRSTVSRIKAALNFQQKQQLQYAANAELYDVGRMLLEHLQTMHGTMMEILEEIRKPERLANASLSDLQAIHEILSNRTYAVVEAVTQAEQWSGKTQEGGDLVSDLYPTGESEIRFLQAFSDDNTSSGTAASS